MDLNEKNRPAQPGTLFELKAMLWWQSNENTAGPSTPKFVKSQDSIYNHAFHLCVQIRYGIVLTFKLSIEVQICITSQIHINLNR